MRALKTGDYVYDDRKRKYRVHTASTCFLYFRNEVQVKKFLVELSTRYTERLKDLNEIYRAITHIAQSQLFVMDDLPQYGRLKAGIDDRLEFILLHSKVEKGDRRGNFFHYSLLTTICSLLYRYLEHVQLNARKLHNTGQDIALYACKRYLDITRLRLHQHIMGLDYEVPEADLSDKPDDEDKQLKIAI